MTNICKVLGQRIRMYRKHQHMSQEKLDKYTVHPDFPYTLIMDDRSNLPLQAYELFTKESVENQEKLLHLLTYALLLKK